MIRDNYLDIHKLIKDKKILSLFDTVESHGGVLRFVGGAVRDTLAGIKGKEPDLDLATDLSPEELVEACEENGLKTVPIGIKFGTVGVVIGSKVLEVTSLRKDVSTDGRHAEVEFTDDWNTDASRRDLTINAVYADEKGNVFDYYNGIDDLENGVVRFIGNPSQRIQEDYLRIMRFFRFYAIFSKGEIDKKALKACVENKDGLKSLSIERIRDEMYKIIMTDKAAETIRIMFQNGILDFILPESDNLDNLQFLINLVKKHNIPSSALRRLFVLYSPEERLAESLALRIKLPKKDRDNFVKWALNNPPMSEFLSMDGIRRLLYRFGRDFCYNKLLILCALNKFEPENLPLLLERIETMEIPVFPLKGKDIIAVGIQDNRKIGTILDKLEEEWIFDNFTLSKEVLLEKAKSLIQNVA